MKRFIVYTLICLFFIQTSVNCGTAPVLDERTTTEFYQRNPPIDAPHNVTNVHNNYDNRAKNTYNNIVNISNSSDKESEVFQYVLFSFLSAFTVFFLIKCFQGSDGDSPRGLFDQKE